MMTTLIVGALLAVQAPPPPPRTVEDRLGELEQKLARLEQKQKALSDENAAMETKVAARNATVEAVARTNAKVWVAQHAAAVGFTEAQSTELEALWVRWNRESPNYSGTAEEWKKREEILRGKLTPEQVPLLVRRIRSVQEKGYRALLAHIVRSFSLPAERTAEWEKTVLAKIPWDADMLIPAAHGRNESPLRLLLAAVEESLPELSLSPEEQASVRKGLEQFQPRRK